MRYTTWKMRGKWQNCLLTYNIQLYNFTRVFCYPTLAWCYDPVTNVLKLWLNRVTKAPIRYEDYRNTHCDWYMLLILLPMESTCIKRLITHTQYNILYLFPLSFSNSTQQAESKLFTFRFAPLYYYRIVCISCRMLKIVVFEIAAAAASPRCQKENVFLLCMSYMDTYGEERRWR